MPMPQTRVVTGGHHGRQRGVVAIEFMLIFLFGVIPLLFLTFSGVLIFAAQQSLTLAAADGARAALRYGTTEQRRNYACVTAQTSMQWLVTFAGQSVDCSNPPTTGNSSSIAVTTPFDCYGGAQCITVTTSYNYDKHPFLPGTDWVMNKTMSSTATIQLDGAL